MASDQEVAQQILGIQQAQQAGQLDAATAQQLMDEQGLSAPINPNAVPPEALQANPPAALAQSPTDIVVPNISPEMVHAAQVADAQEQARNTLSVPAALAPIMPANLESAPAEVQPMPSEIQASQQTIPIPEPAVQPSIDQVKAAEQSIVKPVQEAIAEHNAVKVAQKDLQSQFANQQEEYQHQQEQIQAEINKRDDFVRQKSLPEIMQKGSFGEKLSATIALLLGGLSAGLTGAKTNPVMDFIEKQVEAQAQRDKMSQENKLALKKQLVDIAQLKMQNIANQSQDMFHKQSLEQEAAKLALTKQQIEGDQALKAAELYGKQSSAAVAKQAEAGAPITDLSVLTEDQRKRVVHRPDGTYVLARVGPDQVDAFAKQRAEIEPGIAGVDRIVALTKDFNRVTDLQKRAQIGSEIKALAGSLRVPFTGPGALTEREYDRLIETIGDPTAMIAVPSLQMARLHQVQTKLKADLNNGFRRIGVDIPLNREDQLVQNLMQKGYSEDVVRKVLNKQK